MPEHTNPYIESCPLGCQAPFGESGIRLAEGPLMKCSECGQLFFQSGEDYYTASISKFDTYCGTCPEANISKRMLARTLKTIRRVEQQLGKPKTAIRALDVGCSSGSLIRTLQSLGITAEGVEPMPKPAQAASDYGFKVYQGYLEELSLPENAYNLITLIEVIEHLRNPVALLTECHRLLESEGILVIRTGNVDSWTVKFMKEKWDYFSPCIGHISFFNPESMRVLAERTGFILEKINYQSVSLFKQGDVSPTLYRAGKILAELLNLPSKITGKGQELEVYLRVR